jgi:DNA-binding beta-propeller fold protein YncE
MAAATALTALWLMATGAQSPPLLVEEARIDVARTVRGLTAGAGGAWYLTDPERHLVLWYRSDGTIGGTVGGYGWTASALDDPSGVATDGNRVYVADRGNHRLVSYDRALRPLATFATRDTSDARARFGYPNGVAVSGRGDLLVIDGESDEVIGFRPDRRVAFRVGREVPGGPALQAPTCVGVDDAGRVIIGEAGGVRVLDLFGTHVRRVVLGEGTVVRGVAGFNGWLAAVSADTLYLEHGETGNVYRWPRVGIATGSPLEELWGVAWQEGRLLLLSAGSVVRLRIEFS